MAYKKMTEREKKLIDFQMRVYEAIKEFRRLKEAEVRGAAAGILNVKETYLMDRIIEAAEDMTGAKHPYATGRTSRARNP